MFDVQDWGSELASGYSATPRADKSFKCNICTWKYNIQLYVVFYMTFNRNNIEKRRNRVSLFFASRGFRARLPVLEAEPIILCSSFVLDFNFWRSKLCGLSMTGSGQERMGLTRRGIAYNHLKFYVNMKIRIQFSLCMKVTGWRNIK